MNIDEEVYVESYGGSLSLIDAVRIGDLRIAQLLLDMGVDIRSRGKMREGILACGLSDIRITEFLLDRGADPNAHDDMGSTPLMRLGMDMAIYHKIYDGDLRIARLLLDRGADPDTYDDRGHSLLGLSICNGMEPLTSLLLDKGANPDRQGAYENEILPLMDAARRRFGRDTDSSSSSDVALSNIRLLLRYGANPNIRDSTGATPIMYLARIDDVDSMEVMINKGADINAADDAGRTPLMYASTEGSKGAIRLLLRRWADTTVSDEDGKTAAQLASTVEVSNIIVSYPRSIHSNRDRSRLHKRRDFSDIGISFR